MENEHKVRSTKTCLRGLHSQLSDISVEKTILGSNVLDIINSHDREAMLLQEDAGKSSYRYFNEEKKKRIRDEIIKMKPFDYSRNKIEYFDKPRPVFSGLTAEQLDRFLIRNRNNFKRNSPHRPEMLETETVDAGREKLFEHGAEEAVMKTVVCGVEESGAVESVVEEEGFAENGAGELI